MASRVNVENLTVGEIKALIVMIIFIAGCFSGLFALWYRVISMEKRSFHRQEDTKIIFTALRGCLEGLKEQGCNGEVTKSLRELNEYTTSKTAGRGGDGRVRK